MLCLFRRMTVRLIILIICIHTWMAYDNIWHDKSIPDFANPTVKYGGVWRFLTVQNFFLHLIVNALLLTGELFQPAKNLGNILHYGVSFGTTWIVVGIFWPLYVVNQELILPRRNEVYYPFWLNCVGHGLIAPFALINSVLERRTGTHHAYFTALFIFLTSYVVWLLHIYHATGQWVYPFLAAAGYTKVVLIILPLTTLLCGMTALVGVWANDTQFNVKLRQQ